MSIHNHPKIVIIGASISGLTLAFSLLKTNSFDPTDIQILETRALDSKPGGPVTLAPNSLRLLDRLGVETKVRAKGFSFSHGTFWDSQGRYEGYGPFGGKERFGYDALRIQRATLIATLKEEVQALGAEIEYDSSLREAVSEDNDGVTFRIRKGGKDSNNVIKIRAGILVGADGLHSKSRTFILGGRGVAPIYNGMTMVASLAQTSRLRFTNGFNEPTCNNERVLAVSTSKGSIFMVSSDPEGEDQLYARQFPFPDRNREEWEALDADKDTLMQIRTR